MFLDTLSRRDLSEIYHKSDAFWIQDDDRHPRAVYGFVMELPGDRAPTALDMVALGSDKEVATWLAVVEKSGINLPTLMAIIQRPTEAGEVDTPPRTGRPFLYDNPPQEPENQEEVDENQGVVPDFPPQPGCNCRNCKAQRFGTSKAPVTVNSRLDLFSERPNNAQTNLDRMQAQVPAEVANEMCWPGTPPYRPGMTRAQHLRERRLFDAIVARGDDYTVYRAQYPRPEDGGDPEDEYGLPVDHTGAPIDDWVADDDPPYLEFPDESVDCNWNDRIAREEDHPGQNPKTMQWGYT